LIINCFVFTEIVCNDCWDFKTKSKSADPCASCGDGHKEWFSFDCVKLFTQYLYEVVAVKAQDLKCYVYVFAHNAKGYDGHFILQDILKRKFDNLKIIMTGLKVLKMDVANVKFIDSLSFFQQPLSSLPKSFGFNEIVEKGFFPHHFNKESNYEYSGSIPPISEFNIDFMSSSTADECRRWHKQLEDSNYEYNFENELKKYCRNDVKILMIAIMEFRKLFTEVTGIDPITRCFTLASIGMEYFKAKVLSENSVGITPINGYVPNRIQSNKGHLWLDWIQHTISKPVSREYRIGKYFADGYIETDRHVLEFFGCHFHGCSDCAKKYDEDVNRKRVELNNQSLKYCLFKTNEKVSLFISLNLNFDTYFAFLD
jgi:hypothetical protein